LLFLINFIQTSISSYFSLRSLSLQWLCSWMGCFFQCLHVHTQKNPRILSGYLPILSTHQHISWKYYVRRIVFIKQWIWKLRIKIKIHHFLHHHYLLSCDVSAYNKQIAMWMKTSNKLRILLKISSTNKEAKVPWIVQPLEHP